jgi:hypothetical protein
MADLPPDFDALERRILEGTPEEQAAFLNEVRERVMSGLQEAEVNIMTGSLPGYGAASSSPILTWRMRCDAEPPAVR